MIELCRVKKQSKRYCYIYLDRSEKCESCKICAFNRKKTLVVPAVCDIRVPQGASVVVEMPTQAVGAGSLLIYALPLFFMVIGALIGLVGGMWLQVGLSAGGVVLGLLAAWLIDRAYRRRPGVLPKVLRVAEEGDKAEADTQIKQQENNDQENV